MRIFVSLIAIVSYFLISSIALGAKCNSIESSWLDIVLQPMKRKYVLVENQHFNKSALLNQYVRQYVERNIGPITKANIKKLPISLQNAYDKLIKIDPKPTYSDTIKAFAKATELEYTKLVGVKKFITRKDAQKFPEWLLEIYQNYRKSKSQMVDRSLSRFSKFYRGNTSSELFFKEYLRFQRNAFAFSLIEKTDLITQVETLYKLAEGNKLKIEGWQWQFVDQVAGTSTKFKNILEIRNGIETITLLHPTRHRSVVSPNLEVYKIFKAFSSIPAIKDGKSIVGIVNYSSAAVGEVGYFSPALGVAGKGKTFSKNQKIEARFRGSETYIDNIDLAVNIAVLADRALNKSSGVAEILKAQKLQRSREQADIGEYFQTTDFAGTNSLLFNVLSKKPKKMIDTGDYVVKTATQFTGLRPIRGGTEKMQIEGQGPLLIFSEKIYRETKWVFKKSALDEGAIDADIFFGDVYVGSVKLNNNGKVIEMPAGHVVWDALFSYELALQEVSSI